MSAPPPAVNVTICTCEGDHVAAITTIYAHHVLHGLASFEIEPPSENEMLRRHLDIVSRNYPYLVAECGGEVVGTPTRRPTACGRLTAIPPKTRSTSARIGLVEVSVDS